MHAEELNHHATKPKGPYNISDLVFTFGILDVKISVLKPFLGFAIGRPRVASWCEKTTFTNAYLSCFLLLLFVCWIGKPPEALWNFRWSDFYLLLDSQNAAEDVYIKLWFTINFLYNPNTQHKPRSLVSFVCSRWKMWRLKRFSIKQKTCRFWGKLIAWINNSLLNLK